jgi:hypothetical protein
MGFETYEIMYTQFYLDETLWLSVFFTLSTCHLLYPFFFYYYH